MQQNVVGWFEIPVLDIQRGISFYSAVFGYDLHFLDLGQLKMALFPGVKGCVGAPGALVELEAFYKPSKDGALLYFASPSGDLAEELARVEPNGGKIQIQKRLISPENGFMALFEDSEGNRIGLRSAK